MPTDRRAHRLGALLLALAVTVLAAPAGAVPGVRAAQPEIVDPDPPAPEPTPVPGVPRTVLPKRGATAPDGVPLGAAPARSTTRPTDLPAPGDPALTTGPTGRASCTATHAITSTDPAGAVHLGLSGTGGITAVKAGTRCLERLSYSGGFSVRLAGGQANMLANSSFESGTSSPTSWARSGTGVSPVSQTSEAKSGTRAVKITRSAPAGTSAQLSQRVSVAKSTNYVLSGWFMAAGVKPTSGASTNPVVSKDVSPLEIQAVVTDCDDDVLPGDFRAYGYTDNADWNFQSVGFRTPADACWVTVSLRMKAGYGTGYFDALWLSPLLAPSSVPTASSTITSGGAGVLNQVATYTGQPLRLNATYTAKLNHIRIDGKITNTGTSGNVTADDRALQVTFNLPVNVTNWVWADYARRSRTIATNIRYEFDNHQLTPTSRYPWATVYDASSAVSLGSPIDVPRGYTTRYDTRQGFTITFDLGVSRSATKLGKAATFSILLFASDPSWGFRGATDRFYQIAGGAFSRDTSHAANEGIPFITAGVNGSGLAQLDPAGAVDESDFGLAMNLIGLGYNSDWGKEFLEWDDPRGITTTAYTHLWGDFRNRCPSSTPNCNNLTYGAYVAELQADAAGPPGRVRDESAAALRNAAKDFNGRIRYDLSSNRKEYRTFLNADPDIASNPTWAAVIDQWMLQNALDTAAATPGTLEGIYVDSTSGFRQWGQVDDYDRTKWAKADSPLYLSYTTGRVAQRTYFNNYEQVKRVKAWLDARDMYLTMDYNAQELTEGGFLGADLPDYFLIENGLPDRDYPDWGVTMDSYAMQKRAMAYQRPIGSVDEHGCKAGFALNGSTAAQDSLRFRVQQSLFYGIYAGPCRWETTSWWSATHRAIYRIYSGLFRELGLAGWEPVVNARSSDPAVWLERYGKLKDGDLHLALRNETSTNKTATITLLLDNVYDDPAGTVTALTGRLRHQTGSYPNGPFAMTAVRTYSSGLTGVSKITIDTAARTATLSVTIPAYTTGVLEIDRP